LPGSILGEEMMLSWDALGDLGLDLENPWYRKYMSFIDTLVESSAGRYPVSHGTLVGPSDMAALLRGHGQVIIDLLEDPAHMAWLLERMGAIFRQVTEAAWARIPPFYGGYYDAQYQLWAPGPIARLQEDATALFSPRLYREYVQPIDQALARHFPSAFMHLHSTSMFLLEHFLAIEELRCFEINYDVSGPPLDAMVPFFQRVQGADRALLIRGTFTTDEAALLMEALQPRGLYVYNMVTSWDEIQALRGVYGLE